MYVLNGQFSGRFLERFPQVYPADTLGKGSWNLAKNGHSLRAAALLGCNFGNFG
jgi:hypothetical protein